MSPNEIRDRAVLALRGRSDTAFEDTQYLARAILRVLNDYAQVADDLAKAEAQRTDLFQQRQCLKTIIEHIAAAAADARPQLIADALVTARAMQ